MIDYDERIWSLLKLEGSVMPGALIQALPCTVFAVLLCALNDEWPEIREESGWTDWRQVSAVWNAMTTCIGILMALRIKQALGRFWEGTGLLHQMRGEWFDAASCLCSFSRDAKINKHMEAEVTEFRSTLIRLMSLMHGSALDEISEVNQGVCYEVIDVGGLDTDTLLFLRQCQVNCNFSKVEALQHLIQVLVTENFHKGVLTIPPPILSRIYQTLSRGFVNLLNARKIKDTMFPFPFVQTIKVLLIVHSFFTPVLMTTILDSSFWAVLFTFIPLFGLNCLNLAAWQLEMPFGADANDLPLEEFQYEMNDTLKMLVSKGSDHCPRTSSAAISLRSLAGDDTDVSVSMEAMSQSASLTIGNISSTKVGWDPRIEKKRSRSSELQKSNTRSMFDQAFLRQKTFLIDPQSKHSSVHSSRSSGAPSTSTFKKSITERESTQSQKKPQKNSVASRGGGGVQFHISTARRDSANSESDCTDPNSCSVRGASEIALHSVRENLLAEDRKSASEVIVIRGNGSLQDPSPSVDSSPRGTIPSAPRFRDPSPRPSPGVPVELLNDHSNLNKDGGGLFFV